MRIILLTALAACLLLVAGVSATSASNQSPCLPDDCQQDYGSGGTESEWEPNALCKTVRVWRRWNTWWGGEQFRYNQRTRWCWNSSAITSVNRSRWATVNCCGWGFYGHISNSCASENCAEQIGRTWADIITVGQFKLCAQWCAREVDPGVQLRIYRGGSWAWSSWN